MALLWRYLLKDYCQVLLLCIGAFIAALLTTRFQSIAELATIVPKFHLIALFILCQIPYILPIALPIAGLIAAILLIQRLSTTHELTALRTAGLSIHQIYAPLLFAALLLSLVTFLMTSEMTPRCRLYSYQIIHKAMTSNPLLLIQKPKLLKLGDSHVEMTMTHSGRCAKDFILAIKDQSKDQLRLLLAKQIAVKDHHLIGEKISLISHLPAGNAHRFDHLLIENEHTMTTDATKLSELLRKSHQKVQPEHLPLISLLHALRYNLIPGSPPFYQACFELCRRCYFTLMTFIFTLFGLSLGIQIGRQRQRRTLTLAITLPVLALISSVAAKSLANRPLLSISCYLFPLTLTLILSLHTLKKVAKGRES
ncbi:MAG: LptF/LptG family permease [Chlamydiota bacterium]